MAHYILPLVLARISSREIEISLLQFNSGPQLLSLNISLIKMSKHPFVRIEYASFATSTQVISPKQKEEILSVAVEENNHHGMFQA